MNSDLGQSTWWKSQKLNPGFLFSHFVSLLLRKKTNAKIKCKSTGVLCIQKHYHCHETCILKCQFTYEQEWLSRINNQKRTVYREYSLELNYSFNGTANSMLNPIKASRLFQIMLRNTKTKQNLPSRDFLSGFQQQYSETSGPWWLLQFLPVASLRLVQILPQGLPQSLDSSWHALKHFLKRIEGKNRKRIMKNFHDCWKLQSTNENTAFP